VLAAALPTIVRITASRMVDPNVQIFGKDLPFEFHFKPGGPKVYPQNEPSYGAGVIISKDGYIVTNDHVIAEAKDVTVELQDKRSFAAHVVAADDPVDVAVLKIDATDLPALPWGDSDNVRVGEQVFAIGNPFNLEDSATKGIVSAVGRNLPDSPEDVGHYENFIQTDAAINPGNSGGALINIQGELIGINTAIASTSHGNMGVGFALPSNFVRYAVEGLLKEGRLVRGYLGVRLPDSVDDGVMASFHLNTGQGALLAGVQTDSPAAKAGLAAGDFITEVDGHKINDVADLRFIVAQLPIGKEVVVNYIRDGMAQAATVKIGELPPEVGAANPEGENDEATPPGPSPSVSPAKEENVLSGLQVQDLDDKARQKYGVVGNVSGVVISEVGHDSLAGAKGIQPGDVIESACVNRGATTPLVGAKDFADLVKNLKPDESVVLLVHQGAGSSFIYLAPEK
jgi:serine protease Do